MNKKINKLEANTPSKHIQQHFKELLNIYLHNPCFTDAAFLNPPNPYVRPLRTSDTLNINYDSAVALPEVYTNKNLIINKLLLNIYEQDLLFLANGNACEAKKDFANFYNPYYTAIGKALLPKLEQLAFNFLKDEIEIIGNWTKPKLLEYLINTILEQEKETSELCEAIVGSNNPIRAAKMLLIQMAPDFLSEASAMARALPGSFGIEQSELMKVFIDEYGYGVHETKHSTLFEATMLSANLNPTIHYYYNDYLATSLMLVNYFHCICKNKSDWFKYIGTLYYTEASIPHFNKQISKTLKNILPNINTKYFDEHVHIDKHHRRMVLEKIIATSIDKYGEEIIEDILFGFEAFKLLQNLADTDLAKQIQFSDQLDESYFPSNYTLLAESLTFNETELEITSAHLHADDELFQVTRGELIFYPNSLSPIILKANHRIVIPKGRLHST
ncbi:TPA: iron-containing redox enzyme family protein, partial [Legionella pneumophila]|nr:iron-containing redox enzyme family protein [Legionella pneumophila]